VSPASTSAYRFLSLCTRSLSPVRVVRSTWIHFFPHVLHGLLVRVQWPIMSSPSVASSLPRCQVMPVTRVKPRLGSFGGSQSSLHVACSLLPRLVLELPDSRLEFSYFLVVLLWWFLRHAHKMLIEMCVRK
jgi:hypothetical protein